MVAAEVGAHSADHLIYVDEPHARRLADRNVVATLLPSAAFFLKLGRYAPARMLIDHGVAVALASDLNPGGGFTTSMPFAMTLACFGMNLTLEEALMGATLNAAASLDRADSIGSLEAGKQFDAVIVSGHVDRPDPRRRPRHQQGDQTRPRRLSLEIVNPGSDPVSSFVELSGSLIACTGGLTPIQCQERGLTPI